MYCKISIIALRNLRFYIHLPICGVLIIFFFDKNSDKEKNIFRLIKFNVHAKIAEQNTRTITYLINHLMLSILTVIHLYKTIKILCYLKTRKLKKSK